MNAAGHVMTSGRTSSCQLPRLSDTPVTTGAAGDGDSDTQPKITEPSRLFAVNSVSIATIATQPIESRQEGASWYKRSPTEWSRQFEALGLNPE